MYAIIRTGGKQAKVRPGDVIEVERLKSDDSEVTFKPLLVVDDQGQTHSDKETLANAAVVARVLGETKGPKVDIFKYKNKTGYRRRMGHRQVYTEIEITSIDLPGRASKPKAAAGARAKQAAAETAAASEEE